jgi:hypothetical protein
MRATEVDAAVELSKKLKEESLVKPAEQKTDPEPVVEEAPSENVSLSDYPIQVDANGNFVPELKQYLDAKVEIIKNLKPDGTSEINGVPVRLTAMSTQSFENKDFAPDTQRAAAAGNANALRGMKEGVGLVITDLKGQPIRFTSSLLVSDEGNVIFYNFRDSLKTPTLLKTDLELADRIAKEQNISKGQAIDIVKKKLLVLAKIRSHVKADPTKNKVALNVLTSTDLHKTSTVNAIVPIEALQFGDAPFAPRLGNPENGELANVYYFNYKGVKLSLDRPAIPTEIVDKLVQLLTTDLVERKGTTSRPFTVQEKMILFKQFVYISADVFDMGVDRAGVPYIKKFGEVMNYATPEDFAKDLRAFLTRRVPINLITSEAAKKLFAARKATRVTDYNLKTAQFNQIWEQVLPNGNVRYFKIGIAQMSTNKTLFASGVYKDFEITNGTIKVTPKDYLPLISKHFTVKTNVEVTSDSGTVLNFEVAPEGVLEMSAPAEVVSSEATPQGVTPEASTTTSEPVEKTHSLKEVAEDAVKETPLNKLQKQRKRKNAPALLLTRFLARLLIHMLHQTN